MESQMMESQTMEEIESNQEQSKWLKKLANLGNKNPMTTPKLLGSKTLLFLVLALLQLAAPLYLAQSWNTVLTEGETFRFALKATEATELHHGQYAYLNLEADHAPFRDHIKRGDTVYAVLDKSKFGLARVLEVRQTPPEGQVYIAAEVYDIRGNEAYISYPFSVYYLSDEEKHHLKVESLKDQMQYTVTVKVKDGHAVAEKLNFKE